MTFWQTEIEGHKNGSRNDHKNRDTGRCRIVLRVIVASILGYMIGYERKNRDKSAGMRTHAIVALGQRL